MPVIAAHSFNENDSAFGLGEIGGTTAACCGFFETECLLKAHLLFCISEGALF
jgi:hypothetical protein